MSIADIKHKLIEKINQSSNDLLLQEMYQLLNLDEGNIEILEVSNEQQDKIEAAQKQYNQGNIISQEVADKEMDEWLSK